MQMQVQALADGKVTVNGKTAAPDTVIKNGEVISHTLHRHEPPVTGHEIGIIHEDNDILVIDKPRASPSTPPAGTTTTRSSRSCARSAGRSSSPGPAIAWTA